MSRQSFLKGTPILVPTYLISELKPYEKLHKDLDAPTYNMMDMQIKIMFWVFLIKLLGKKVEDGPTTYDI
jgi:hypothetical protein